MQSFHTISQKQIYIFVPFLRLIVNTHNKALTHLFALNRIQCIHTLPITPAQLRESRSREHASHLQLLLLLLLLHLLLLLLLHLLLLLLLLLLHHLPLPTLLPRVDLGSPWAFFELFQLLPCLPPRFHQHPGDLLKPITLRNIEAGSLNGIT